MNAMEFQASVVDGKIELPEECRDQIHGRVRVIILTEEHPKSGRDRVRELIENPISVKEFTPFRRSEIYNGR